MFNNFNDASKETLALGFCQFNKPLWKARNVMQAFLEENFELKREPITLTATDFLSKEPVKVGSLVVINGEECFVTEVRKRG